MAQIVAPAPVVHRLKLLDSKPPGLLVVHEIYRSIQGESTFAGLPCVMVRLAACNLRCRWCDTPHAFNQGEPLALDEAAQKVLAYNCPLVEITGGEPLLQPEVFPLMTRLSDAGLTVLLETSGAEDIRPVDTRVHIIMDLKCPGSGESARNRWENLEHLKPTDQIKFVIADRTDFDWAAAAVRHHRLAERFHVLFSSVFAELDPTALAEWILDANLPVRLQLQLHKYLWDPQARGV